MSLRYFTILALSATLVTAAVAVGARAAEQPAQPESVTQEGTSGEAEAGAGTADTYRYGLGSMRGPAPGFWGGYGYGPHMMGGHWPAMMGYYGHGPGMMGRYGPFPGMMPGPGPAYSAGTWGPGWPGPQRDLNLTADDVRRNLERMIAFQRNPNLKIGKVEETNTDTIEAEIVTTDDALVQRFEVDRHTGFYRPEGSEAMMGYGPDWGMMGSWGGGTWGASLLMHIIWLLILVAIILGIVWLVRSAAHGGGREPLPPRRSAGLDILEERYARGEIDRDEYTQKKRDLSG